MKSLINELRNYQNELEEINEELQTLPKGRLAKKGKFYYHSKKGKEVGITKKPELIRQLCRKEHLLARKEQLLNNIYYLTVDASKIDTRSPWELISSVPSAYQGLPISYFYHPTMEAWLEESYDRHPYSPDEGSYMTKNGVQLRSKSELLIATQLEYYKIPYRYEAELKLGSKPEYPDFTIKNPFTGKSILWEHFGGLHLSGYEKRMNEKMDRYLTHNYVPFDTIIYTFEFQTKNADRIQKLIEDIII